MSGKRRRRSPSPYHKCVGQRETWVQQAWAQDELDRKQMRETLRQSLYGCRSCKPWLIPLSRKRYLLVGQQGAYHLGVQVVHKQYSGGDPLGSS